MFHVKQRPRGVFPLAGEAQPRIIDVSRETTAKAVESAQWLTL